MPFKTRYVFVVSMDVDPDKDAIFNEVYNTEHIPELMKVPGVLPDTPVRFGIAQASVLADSTPVRNCVRCGKTMSLRLNACS